MIKTLTLVILLITGVSMNSINAHCQIPCGIYDDDIRFKSLLEDVATLRKSVSQIIELSASNKINNNQIVRWVINKEKHADHISDTIQKYFLAQRIKTTHDNYREKLVISHKIIVLSMKVKQSSDLKIIDELELAITNFHNLYYKNNN